MTKNNTRKPLIALIALGAAIAMPMAFAQDTQAQQQPQQTQQAEPTQQAQPTTDQAAGGAEQSAQQSTQSGSQQGWADIDKDGDGNITKEEAAANAGLSQVFDKADGDADGSDRRRVQGVRRKELQRAAEVSRATRSS